MRARPLLPADPRIFQIAILVSLLAYGVAVLRFDVSPAQIALTVATALLTQLTLTRVVGLGRFDWRSPLISSLSLCLLLRTSWLPLAAIAAVIAIGSKFVVRVRGKHVFNPTNLALAALLVVTDAAWVSPSQWGSKVHFAFLLACLGGLVVYRSTRTDVTVAFLGAYLAILFGRAFWLGDPWAIPLHQAKSGALLIFAFFMISDPKTTPDSRLGRALFAVAVALGAGFVQFVLYRQNGLLYALAFASPLVPLLDRWMPAGRYEWTGRISASTENQPCHPERSEGTGREAVPAPLRAPRSLTTLGMTNGGISP